MDAQQALLVQALMQSPQNVLGLHPQQLLLQCLHPSGSAGFGPMGRQQLRATESSQDSASDEEVRHSQDVSSQQKRPQVSQGPTSRVQCAQGASSMEQQASLEQTLATKRPGSGEESPVPCKRRHAPESGNIWVAEKGPEMAGNQQHPQHANHAAGAASSPRRCGSSSNSLASQQLARQSSLQGPTAAHAHTNAPVQTLSPSSHSTHKADDHQCKSASAVAMATQRATGAQGLADAQQARGPPAAASMQPQQQLVLITHSNGQGQSAMFHLNHDLGFPPGALQQLGPLGQQISQLGPLGQVAALLNAASGQAGAATPRTLQAGANAAAAASSAAARLWAASGGPTGVGLGAAAAQSSPLLRTPAGHMLLGAPGAGAHSSKPGESVGTGASHGSAMTAVTGLTPSGAKGTSSAPGPTSSAAPPGLAVPSQAFDASPALSKQTLSASGAQVQAKEAGARAPTASAEESMEHDSGGAEVKQSSGKPASSGGPTAAAAAAAAAHLKMLTAAGGAVGGATNALLALNPLLGAQIMQAVQAQSPGAAAAGAAAAANAAANAAALAHSSQLAAAMAALNRGGAGFPAAGLAALAGNAQLSQLGLSQLHQHLMGARLEQLAQGNLAAVVAAAQQGQVGQLRAAQMIQHAGLEILQHAQQQHQHHQHQHAGHHHAAGGHSSVPPQLPRPRRARDPATISKVQQCAIQIMRMIGTRLMYERQIREALGNNPDTSKALRLLITQGKLTRMGAGGRGDPFAYKATASGLNALEDIIINALG
uniref:HTH three-helical bundle domain-containing protein n=1 Tax=Chlamydomonas leiostraca TaxID=1034604 RepID=A0A7S0S294_9CHLO|mmetsp:Transcript_5557/g.13838  ORF Transcript_5557/g.13838 Transcript_5557/m.13838 type:complete len:769 (+) Transcript_5557:205-2511(+)